MSTKVRLTISILVVAMLFVLSACGSASNSSSNTNDSSGSGGGNGAKSSSGSKEDILIGAYGPLTGSTAQYGQSMQKNMEMYFDGVNKNGGINGRKIKLIVEDDGGKPDQGINAVNKLIEKDKVIAVLGGPLSNVNLAVMKVTQKAKIPHIATSSGNPKITESGDPHIFRVVPKDTAIAAAVAEYAMKVKKNTKIAILHGTDEYGKGGGEAAVKKLESLGVKPVAVETFNPNDKNYTAQLTNFKQAGAQSVIFWGYYTEGAIVMKQNKELGLNAQIIGGTGLNNPKFAELAGNSVEGGLFGSPFIAADPSIKDYIDAYKAKYNELPDMTGACGYDAAQLIVAALKAVGTDSQKINDWLHQVKDFKGVTGALTSDKNGDLNDQVKIIEVHKDGSQTVAWDPGKK